MEVQDILKGSLGKYGNAVIIDKNLPFKDKERTTHWYLSMGKFYVSESLYEEMKNIELPVEE